jgi:CPA2 family monovalent cation:H+ antiporter-2
MAIAATALLAAVKVATNVAASLLFRWSVPGSLQLGFLIAQGSEFALVILSLAPVRALVGAEATSILVAAVALSLALTPTLAAAGRRLAGRLRARRRTVADPELQRRELAAPVLIVGMGPVGRTVADGLGELGIAYGAIERDPTRFAEANADGYQVVFGDAADPRIWEPIAMRERRIAVLTAPRLEVSRAIAPLTARAFPDLRRMAVVRDESEQDAFREAGVQPVLDRSVPPGLDAASAVLRELGADDARIGAWMRRQQERSLGEGGAQAAA